MPLVLGLMFTWLGRHKHLDCSNMLALISSIQGMPQVCPPCPSNLEGVEGSCCRLWGELPWTSVFCALGRAKLRNCPLFWCFMLPINSLISDARAPPIELSLQDSAILSEWMAHSPSLCQGWFKLSWCLQTTLLGLVGPKRIDYSFSSCPLEKGQWHLQCLHCVMSFIAFFLSRLCLLNM